MEALDYRTVLRYDKTERGKNLAAYSTLQGVELVRKHSNELKPHEKQFKHFEKGFSKVQSNHAQTYKGRSEVRFSQD